MKIYRRVYQYESGYENIQGEEFADFWDATRYKIAELEKTFDTFGETLKESRKQKKMTCRELADATETTVGHIADLEHDRSGVPSLSEIEDMENTLGIEDGRLKAFYDHDNIYQKRDAYTSTVYVGNSRKIQISEGKANKEALLDAWGID
jgi:transcriptional regulator with XRE-family HTH domain